jgi:S1-C subfamily serine protease
LIKVDKTGLTPITFASSSTVELGDWATVIGSPLDYQNSVTLGMPELYLPPGSTGAENIGFAIPADVVASVAHTLMSQ